MTIKRKSVAIWSIVASMLFLSSALPSAYGLEFPANSTVELQGDATALAASANPLDSAAALYMAPSIWPRLQWAQCSLQIWLWSHRLALPLKWLAPPMEPNK